MNFLSRAITASAVVSSAVFGTGILLPSAAAAQVTLQQCDQIQDHARRQRCRSAVYDAQNYRQEAQDWKGEEARIRADQERACQRVGMVGRLVKQGALFRVVCEAPQRIYDARH
jgi:hypothetical protein